MLGVAPCQGTILCLSCSLVGQVGSVTTRCGCRCDITSQRFRFMKRLKFRKVYDIHQVLSSCMVFGLMPWASHCCPHILTVLMTTIKQPSLLRLWVSQKILVLYLYQYGFRYTKLQAFPKEVKQTCQIKKFDLYKFRFIIGPLQDVQYHIQFYSGNKCEKVICSVHLTDKPLVFLSSSSAQTCVDRAPG